MPAPTGAVAAPDFHALWVDALDALELDVHEAEQLLAARRTPAGSVDLVRVTADWKAPLLPGPLPENLVARAKAILARQLQVSEDLVHAMRSNRRELRLAQRMGTSGGEAPRPAFLDSKY
jgi:hypothetical protein